MQNETKYTERNTDTTNEIKLKTLTENNNSELKNI